MKSAIRKRSVNLAGHKTSVSLEDDFWFALKEIAAAEKISAFELVCQIDTGRGAGSSWNLSSALRLFVLDYYVQKQRPERSSAVD